MSGYREIYDNKSGIKNWVCRYDKHCYNKICKHAHSNNEPNSKVNNPYYCKYGSRESCKNSNCEYNHLTCEKFERKFRGIKRDRNDTIKEVDNEKVENELKKYKADNQKLVEKIENMEIEIEKYKKTNEILKEANEKMISTIVKLIN